VPILFQKGTLSTIGPTAYQNTGVFQMGLNKISPNFNTSFTTSL